MKSKLAISWIIFISLFIIFVGGVEFLHYKKSEPQAVYQCRILIDKDLAVEDVSSDEEKKSEKISLYEKTSYGILPRKQGDYRKIFNAYSSNIKYDGDYVKVALILQHADSEKIKKIIENFSNAKISFIIPYYINNIEEISKTIVENGNEFFIQLPTQSSIPTDKIKEVSPFLANANPQDSIDKLNYLIASTKYSIGIANTSSSLITKSERDMNLLARELSQRGMSLFNIQDDENVLDEITQHIKLVYLTAKIFNEGMAIHSGEAFLINESQIAKFLKTIPANIKCVPMSFKVKDASI